MNIKLQILAQINSYKCYNDKNFGGTTIMLIFCFCIEMYSMWKIFLIFSDTFEIYSLQYFLHSIAELPKIGNMTCISDNHEVSNKVTI